MRARTIRSAGGDQVAVLDGDDRSEARPFADEVGIDFPSIRPAVERIRRAFLADERPSPLGTVLRLSPREAREGATLPIDVPVRTTCSHCGGRGESWAEPCRACEGSGIRLVRQPLQVTLPAGVRDGTRLHFIVTRGPHLPTPIELRVIVHRLG